MWGINLKATMDKQEKISQQYGDYEREGRGVNKDSQIFGNRRFDFGWWSNSAIYILYIIELYMESI